MYGNKTLLRFYLGLDRTCMTRVMAPYSAKDDGFAFVNADFCFIFGQMSCRGCFI